MAVKAAEWRFGNIVQDSKKDFSEKMINGEEYTQLQDFKIKPGSAGFFEINDGDIHSYGCSTFVSIGKVQGLLTCAHVLKAISGLPQIGLAIFPVRPVSSLFPLNLTECDQIKFGPSCTAEGPDLGFLRLPIPFVSKVSHLVSVKSLETGRADAFAQAEPSDESVTVVAGVIDEWTSKENNNFVVRPLISIGRIDDRIQATDGHDLFHFQPDPDGHFHAPKSYRGTSGGGLWRIYPRPRDGREISYSLIGVAFFETEERQIICHGQASLYVKLFDAIRDKMAGRTLTTFGRLGLSTSCVFPSMGRGQSIPPCSRSAWRSELFLASLTVA